MVSLQTEADETKAAAPLEDEALPVLNNCGAEMGEESGRPEAVLLKVSGFQNTSCLLPLPTLSPHKQHRFLLPSVSA